METLRVTLVPQSAFATPIKGDTLFGQLCWAIVRLFGEDRLTDLLQGYTADNPFLVVSDALPAGFIPMPNLPKGYWQLSDELQQPTKRKELKRRAWLPVSSVTHPLGEWLEHHAKDGILVTDTDSRPHNTINRTTNTTGTGEFAPYAVEQTWFRNKPQLAVYLVSDGLLTPTDLERLLTYVGSTGFGRDASTGLGKFSVERIDRTWDIPTVSNTNAWLTLAPCAPQGLPWNSVRCFYKPFTRFGRHGDVAAITGQPYKTPILLADTAAVLTPAQFEDRLFTGRGLGGNGSLSKAIPGTVHQGYAPVIPISLPLDGVNGP